MCETHTYAITHAIAHTHVPSTHIYILTNSHSRACTHRHTELVFTLFSWDNFNIPHSYVLLESALFLLDVTGHCLGNRCRSSLFGSVTPPQLFPQRASG